MQFRQTFDDLNEFVEAYRGRIGRDGMLLDTETPYQVGTVLGVDVSLAEETPLIRGTAGVIQLLPGGPLQPDRRVAVLEFLILDPASEAFVGRLVSRFEAEGVEPFRFDRYVQHGRRGVDGHDPASPAVDSESPTPLQVPPELVDRSARTITTSNARRRVAARRRWLRAALVAVAAGVAVAGAVTLVRGLSSSTVVAGVDPGPALGATVGSRAAAQAIPTPQPGETPVEPIDAEPVLDADPVPLTAPTARRGTAGPPARRIERITWHEAGVFTLVTLEADGDIDEDRVAYYRMEEAPQPRVVLYLKGIASGGLAYRTLVGGPRLAAVRVWYHDDTSPVQLHVVLDLVSADVGAFRPTVEGRRLLVTLGPRDRRLTAAEPSTGGDRQSP